MSIKEAASGAKPYVIGAIAGVALAAFGGFGSGWLVTRGTMHDAVAEAQVSSIAQVCANEATNYWKTRNQSLAVLKKWDAWSQREKLAKKFAADLPEAKGISDRVVSRCADDMMTS